MADVASKSLLAAAKLASGANELVEYRWYRWRDVAFDRGASESDARAAIQKLGWKTKEQLGLRHDPFQFRSSRDGLQFRAAGIAGSVSLKEISLEVLPKFVPQEVENDWNASSLFLWESLSGKNATPIKAVRQTWRRHRVLDLIARAFADAAEMGLADRPISTYMQIEEAGPVLRGRLNIARQIRALHSRPHLIECDFDQLDGNNVFNDLLKWAARRLAESSADPVLKARLRDIGDQLPGDHAKPPSDRAMTQAPPPQFRTWSDALMLARLVARGAANSTNGGQSSGYSLLFNMERAFERFVELGLSDAVSKNPSIGDRCERQSTRTYAVPVGATGRLYCRPDNVVSRLGHPALVVDAKYKLLDKDLVEIDGRGKLKAPTSPDMYELLIAMVANKCTRGLLVYPSADLTGSSIGKVREWEVDAFGTPMRVGAIPVRMLGIESRAGLIRAFEELGRSISAFAAVSSRD